jgi:hypothetical protein
MPGPMRTQMEPSAQVSPNLSSNGSFGYMQNPMMGAMGQRQLPVQANGKAQPPVPMFEPRSVKV